VIEMAKGKNQHIVTHNGNWAVRAEGADRVTKQFDTKAAATSFGREIARNQHSELVIHGKNGVIQNKDSHGHDPCPPRDTK
jgi:hypothetical protein